MLRQAVVLGGRAAIPAAMGLALTSPGFAPAAEANGAGGRSAPHAVIAAPADGSTYRAGDPVSLRAQVEPGGKHDAAAFSWSIVRHEGQHSEAVAEGAGAEATFTPSGRLDATSYEIRLTATGRHGMTDSASVTIFPEPVVSGVLALQSARRWRADSAAGHRDQRSGSDARRADGDRQRGPARRRPASPELRCAAAWRAALTGRLAAQGAAWHARRAGAAPRRRQAGMRLVGRPQRALHRGDPRGLRQTALAARHDAAHARRPALEGEPGGRSRQDVIPSSCACLTAGIARSTSSGADGLRGTAAAAHGRRSPAPPRRLPARAALATVSG